MYISFLVSTTIFTVAIHFVNINFPHGMSKTVYAKSYYDFTAILIRTAKLHGIL